MKTKMTADQKWLRNTERTISTKKSQKPVSHISISIEWKKSRMYGHNPFLTGRITYTDGTRGTFTSKCSGYGYDKESTVIADLFNNCLSYVLYSVETDGAPYGICKWNTADVRYFSGGIGTNCYYDIAKYIGGEFKKVAYGESYDAYEFKFTN